MSIEKYKLKLEAAIYESCDKYYIGGKIVEEVLKEYHAERLNLPLVVGRSESFVCGHPPKQTYLLNGIWHCEKCGGKWESIANK